MADDMLARARSALRLGGCTDFDQEISDLIDAARAKMRAGGVSLAASEDDDMPLTRTAIIAYVKGGFGLDNPDAERYMESFESMVSQLKCTSEYGAHL